MCRLALKIHILILYKNRNIVIGNTYLAQQTGTISILWQLDHIQFLGFLMQSLNALDISKDFKGSYTWGIQKTECDRVDLNSKLFTKSLDLLRQHWNSAQHCL